MPLPNSSSLASSCSSVSPGLRASWLQQVQVASASVKHEEALLQGYHVWQTRLNAVCRAEHLRRCMQVGALVHSVGKRTHWRESAMLGMLALNQVSSLRQRAAARFGSWSGPLCWPNSRSHSP